MRSSSLPCSRPSSLLPLQTICRSMRRARLIIGVLFILQRRIGRLRASPNLCSRLSCTLSNSGRRRVGTDRSDDRRHRHHAVPKPQGPGRRLGRRYRRDVHGVNLRELVGHRRAVVLERDGVVEVRRCLGDRGARREHPPHHLLPVAPGRRARHLCAVLLLSHQ
uniref:Uncharacterized protein n=1 Tax=Arundo donax TaxID=35708 RepID=A0A0A9FWK1_ARUDO